MCAGSLYMISGWLISQSLRPIYLSSFPSILSWFVFGQLPSANVPPVRLACLCDRIASDGSRSVAMGYCPAGSSLLRRIGLSLGTCYRPLPRDMYPIRSSARSAGISSFLACCSRPVSGRSLSMDLLLDHISLLPDFSTLLHDDMLLALAFHSCPLTLFPADSCCLVSGMFL